MSSPHFTIEPADAGTRLDKFLTAKLPAISRSQIQKLIKAGRATVNGKSVTVHHFLKAGDVVAVADSATVSPPAERVTPAASPAPAPAIINEDDEVVVIDKPAGLLVHPTPHQRRGTLADWLAERYPEIRDVGLDRYRPGIVHRLDRGVSGLMVVAKTQAAYASLVEQFTARTVRKTYAAVVYGTPPQASGTITLPIGRSADGSFVARPAPAARPDDRPAETRYRVLQSHGPYSLLEIEITTGRPHQIRAHLAAIGHPIVGDREYGPRKPFHHDGKKKIKTVALDRLLLHVTGLTFTGLDGKIYSFTCPLPTIFTTFLGEQRKNSNAKAQ